MIRNLPENVLFSIKLIFTFIKTKGSSTCIKLIGKTPIDLITLSFQKIIKGPFTKGLCFVAQKRQYAANLLLFILVLCFTTGQVNAQCTTALSSATGTDAQTVCINTPITNITYSTTGATGATVTNLPTGVTGTWAANVVTIGGTPTVAGTALAYTVTLTGGCGVITTTGTITVDALSSNSCGAFITRWNLATTGTSATSLNIGTATSGTVNYYWQEVSLGIATGSGSFSGSTFTITGLPTGATIRLGIYPTNFQSISINEGLDKSRLLDVEQWGSTVWTIMQSAFYGCNNLTITATDIPVLTSYTSMQQMFRNCSILNGPSNINSWNTAAVTNLVVTPINTGGMIRLSTTTNFVCT